MNKNFKKITEMGKSGGCSCKLNPFFLKNALSNVVFPSCDNLIIGMNEPDDAGVYKLNEDIALIQTVDFFPPMIDDPFVFGKIAAANALSDVYAMGGDPITALNIFCFPAGILPESFAREIIKGGASALQEAGCALAGGHSLNDEGIKYGLAVTGLIRPDRIKTKGGATVGDIVILTKPIGTGIISTADKAGMAEKSHIRNMLSNMISLNKTASEIMRHFEVSACTDVTGFGFFGHLFECALYSKVKVRVNIRKVPLLPGTLDYASFGLMPGGLYSNKNYYSRYIVLPEGFLDGSGSERNELLYFSMFDPQTSGGLLVFAPNDSAETLCGDLKNSGVSAEIVGEIISEGEPEIIIQD